MHCSFVYKSKVYNSIFAINAKIEYTTKTQQKTKAKKL